MNKIIALMALIVAVIVVLISSSGAKTKLYVEVPNGEEGGFTNDLKGIIEKYGISPDVARSEDDRGHIYNILRASDIWTRIWSQNMPLSGRENPEICGHYDEPHPDPYQYVITIDAHYFFSFGRVEIFSSYLKNEFNAAGYKINDKPLLCGKKIKRD